LRASRTGFVFHLGKGEFEGQRLLSPGLIQEIQKPRVHVGAPEFAEYSDVHYGLGLRSHSYRGERVVWHGGGFTGTNTLMMLLPDRGVGVAVLANSGMTPPFAPHILANYVFDRVCGKEPAPWLDRFCEQRRELVAQQDAYRQAAKASRRPATQPGRNLTDYAGDYEHPGYGRIMIIHAEGKLHCAFRGMSDPLVHRHYDTFELPEAPESPGGLLAGQLTLSFSTDREGNIASVAVPFEPLVKDIAFTRIAAGEMIRLGGLAYSFVLAQAFAQALEAADQAIALAPNKIWLYTNRAHALMFLGRIDEARALYQQYRGVKNVWRGKSWETAILEDFADLRMAGLTQPLMDEIEKALNAGG
jgi:tetratricopeptide (TPR) repeat protein